MFWSQKIATVIRIDGAKDVILWWEGKAHRDLLTFDDAGFKLLYDSLSMGGQLQSDVARNNIKLFLNDLLAASKYDFTERGPILLDEPKVKTLLHIE